MIIHKPDYYDSFSCVGGECEFSCCQEWKIAVDSETKKKWKDYSCETSNGMQNGLDSIVYSEEENEYITLNKELKCPFLNDKGLCNIVLKYGESGISKTCHTFPREMHCFDGMTEFTLAMGCPAALKKLWSGNKFTFLSSSDESEVLENDYFDYNFNESADNPVDEDLLLIRDELIKMFDKNLTIGEYFKTAFFILINCYEKWNDDALSKDYIMDMFSDDSVKQICIEVRKVTNYFENTLAERNELFLDLVDNYRKKKIYYNDIEPLAELAEYYEDNKLDLFLDYRVFISSHYEINRMIRILLQEEVYSTLYTPGSDMISVIAKFEWLSITYSAIMHFLFLFWNKNNSLKIDEIVRITAIVIRMTGYSDEDIEEYLENSFEELVWEFGYMALVMGEEDIG